MGVDYEKLGKEQIEYTLKNVKVGFKDAPSFLINGIVGGNLIGYGLEENNIYAIGAGGALVYVMIKEIYYNHKKDKSVEKLERYFQEAGILDKPKE
ncbi:MAG: hypothetical protein KAT28_03235 [Candidatus Aenigmarchaeota archaeon]|nr:hypothetical protein [Candidatus Aenigmarchaeota archaeon]